MEYTPALAAVGTGLKDTLPEGIDLRTDASGTLILESNIRVHKLTPKADGSSGYLPGDELPLAQVQTAVSYDPAGRTLTFTFPDPNQAYRLTYITDITGAPDTIQNQVELVDASGSGTNRAQSFAILESHSGAIMGRSGWVPLKKTATDGTTPLEGAEFTLFNTNPDGSEGSVRALRTSAVDGCLRIYGLPTGKYLLKETSVLSGYQPNPMIYEVVVASEAEGYTTTINGQAVSAANPFVVKNHLTEHLIGSLQIGKTVAGNMGDTAGTNRFSFTVTFTQPDSTTPDTDSYEYMGSGVPNGVITSGEPVQLAHGQGITIIGLPEGTGYTVTETPHPDYLVTIEGTATPDGADPALATGTIVEGETQTALYTNTRNLGFLTIAKTVAGSLGDTTLPFEFTVDLTTPGGIPDPTAYAYLGTGVPDGTITSGDPIALAHGQRIEIQGLPLGTAYEITETRANLDGYRTTVSGTAGIISATPPNLTPQAHFTNTKKPVPDEEPEAPTAELTIRKTVQGDLADTTRQFAFIVSFNAAGSYRYSGSKSGYIKNGDTLFLSHSQSITIHRLPRDIAYEVREVRANKDGYSTSSFGEKGYLYWSDQTAAFTNSRVGNPKTGAAPGDGTARAMALSMLTGLSAPELSPTRKKMEEEPEE